MSVVVCSCSHLSIHIYCTPVGRSRTDVHGDNGWRCPTMARTVRDANLETRTARSRLKTAGKPYYRAIDPGLHLGYRKGVTGGKWVMRLYIGEGDYRVETIGMADDTA